MYSLADGIIAMSHRGKTKIELLPEVKQKKTPVVVVPSCADLDHFRLRSRAAGEASTLRLIYIGTVGGRYLLDRIGRFAAVAERLKTVHLRILTRADEELVKAMLGSSGLSRDAWSVGSVPYSEMPDALANHDAGLFFLSQGISELGCSPTKIGEYWATGLPVVTTPNVSDTDEIIQQERVGIIVKGDSDADYREAAIELQELLKDPDLALRCRRAAESHYALGPACIRQMDLYRDLVSNASLTRHNEQSPFNAVESLKFDCKSHQTIDSVGIEVTDNKTKVDLGASSFLSDKNRATGVVD